MKHIKYGELFSIGGRGLYIAGTTTIASSRNGHVDPYGNVIGIIEVIF